MHTASDTTPENIITAQWKVLGSLFENPRDFQVVNRSFFTGKRQEIYDYMWFQYLKEGYVTPDSVHIKFGHIPQIDVANTRNIKPLVAILSDYAYREKLKTVSTELYTIATGANVDTQKVRELLNVRPIHIVEDSSIQSGAEKYLATLRAKLNKKYQFCRTGLNFLDHKIGGEWKPGTLTIVLGSPGSGKTAFSLNSMVRMGSTDAINIDTGEVLEKPISSLLVSLEMKKEDLFARILADKTEINYKRILEGDRLRDDEIEQINEYSTHIQQLPIYIIDKAMLPLDEILYAIKWHVENHNVRVVFVDYLQIVNYNTGNRISDLGYIAQSLKDLASILNISIILLSQVTDGNEGLERIRDSRVPGQIADIVLEFLFEDSSSNEPTKIGNLMLYKNRYGPLGQHPVMFHGALQRFESGV